MIPNLSASGHSFKGAFAYHMHDKEADTSERVAWTSSRNLMTDDARTAERVMIATAQDADRLKEAAGVKATGRKSTAGQVQTFSLSWHPDEKVSRADMEKAADSALKELGLEKHQAYLVAHNDRAHQHVHVIVNRVNPGDGRTATLSNSKRTLDRWAHSYEQERGRIVSPNRAEKYARQEQARQRYSPEERRAYVERKRQEQTRRTEGRRELIQKAGAKTEAEAHAAVTEAGHAPSRAQILHDLDRAQWWQHRTETGSLNARHIYLEKAEAKAWGAKVSAARNELRNEARNKLEWKDLARSHGQAERARAKLEKTFRGRLSLAITAAKVQREQMRAEGKKASLAALTWANLANADLRRKTFEAVKKSERDALSKKQAERMKPVMARVEGFRDQALQAMKDQHRIEREALKERHSQERRKIQEAWRHLPREARNRAVRGREAMDQGTGAAKKVEQARVEEMQGAMTRAKMARERDESTRQKHYEAREKGNKDAAAQAKQSDKAARDATQQIYDRLASFGAGRINSALRANEREKGDARQEAGKERQDMRQEAGRERQEARQNSPLEQMRENRDRQGEPSRSDGRSALDKMRANRAERENKAPDQNEKPRNRDDRDR